MKVVVLGVNHAGTSLVRTLRKLDKNVEINAYDRNKDISFLGCGIALWVGGEFSDPSGLFYATKEILEKEFNANVKMEHEIIEINSKEKFVLVKDLKTGQTFQDYYDKLVFAGGTWPITIPVEGKDLENILFSKIFAHAKVIKQKNNDPSVKKVVVIGAGYIGVELVEAFNRAGKEVVLIDMIDRVVNRYFDPEFTDVMEQNMKKDGVEFRPGETLVKFEGQNGKVSKVVTNKGSYDADLVIMCAGFRPETKILQGQVDMLPNGAIKVNEYQQSSNENIYAIGDSCSLKHHVLKEAHVALATNAVKTGLVAAFHLSGRKDIKFPGVNGTNAISVFGCHYASTGISEESAKAFKIKHASSYIKDKDRPEFMQSAEDVSFKIVYDPDTLKLLGAQIGSTGKANHTEIIYSMSLAISQGLKITDLALMDYFFLPHFNKPFNFIIQAVLNAINLKY